MDCNSEKESKFETKSLQKQKTLDQVSTLKIETNVICFFFVLCDHLSDGSSENTVVDD